MLDMFQYESQGTNLVLRGISTARTCHIMEEEKNCESHGSLMAHSYGGLNCMDVVSQTKPRYQADGKQLPRVCLLLEIFACSSSHIYCKEGVLL
jgi:hypothetical protein